MKELNMAIVVQGSIPEKITYVYGDRHEISVGCEWDSEYKTGLKQEKIKVTSAYPADSSNKKSIESGINWAKNYKNKPTFQKEIINKSIKNIKICSLEKRGNGGRAYKVIVDGFYVDFREDVLIDTMLKVGVEPGGILKGEFVWARVGSEMKLIREGSELHKFILSFEERKATKKIKNSDLKVGDIYQNIQKKKYIFLGHVNTTTFEDLSDVYYRRKDSFFNFKHKKIENGLLFYHMYGEKKLVSFSQFNEFSFRLELKKTHSCIEKVGSLDVDSDIIKIIRASAIKCLEKDITSFVTKKLNPMSMLDANLAHFSTYINISKVGEPQHLFDIKKVLAFA